MRSLMSILITLAFVAVSLGSLPGMAGTPDQDADIRAPGVYTGPGAEAVPDEWYSWSERTDDDVHKQCGELKLVFRNPDLQEDPEDGKVHASNRFFIQFQAVGETADQVVRFAFSFGKGHEALDNPQLNCNDAIGPNPAGKGVTGGYLLYYRSDYEPRDGFFVPILTTNVPDGDYHAAVHAYNAAGDEIARAWAPAVVENCEGTGSASGTCSPQGAQANDKVQPWPMVLPGDGEQTNGIDGLTVEFGEAVQNDTFQVSVNGEVLDHEWWEAPMRDSDLQPMNDESNDEHPMQECTVSARNVCTRMQYGFAYKVEGIDIFEGDIIRVSALDNNDNLVVKTIHFGKDTSAGGVTSQCAEVQFELLDSDNVELPPNAVHDFPMRLANVGSSDAHVNLVAEYNESKNFSVEFTGVQEDHGHKDMVHSQIEPGGQNLFNLTVTTGADALEGTHEIVAALDYNCDGEPREQAIKMFVSVKEGATGGRSTKIDTAAENNTTVENEEPAQVEEDTPAPGIGVLALVGMAALGAVAVLRRRRDL